MVANVSPTLCEFVAAGVGVSLVHPLIVGGLREKLAIRRFEPTIQLDFSSAMFATAGTPASSKSIGGGARDGRSDLAHDPHRSLRPIRYSRSGEPATAWPSLRSENARTNGR